MKLSGRRARLRLRLEPAEVELLQVLLGQLAEVVAESDAEDPVVARLYPAAYADEAATADFRSLTEDGLRSDRTERIAACRAEVGEEIALGDPDVATRWIKVLNDLRLSLGTRLGVSEDDPEFDPAAPDAGSRVVYHWLTAVQDSIVGALMG